MSLYLSKEMIEDIRRWSAEYFEYCGKIYYWIDGKLYGFDGEITGELLAPLS